MATHSSIFAWRITLAEEPGGLQPVGHKEQDMTEQLTLSLFFSPVLLKVADYLRTNLVSRK